MNDELFFDTSISRYRAIKIIGQGGVGKVYEVENEDNERFAIKIVDLQSITREKVKRFNLETNFLEKNDHKNIVKVLDKGFSIQKNVKCPFYVMKLYKKTLKDFIQEGIPCDKVLPYFSNILDGIEAAHLLKVWHRDLKPENILYDPDNGVFLIADFGIAHFSEPYLITLVETNKHSKLANFRYSAPEQRTKGANITYKADIFALGLILNEMFTHDVPQGTAYQTVAKVAPEFSFLDNIVEKMIRQAPEDRPENIDKIKIEIENQAKIVFQKQKLDKLENTVISRETIDDPLIKDPIRIVSVDYGNSRMSFTLNQSVNKVWVDSFHRVGTNGYSLSRNPNISFDKNVGSIDFRDTDTAQTTYDFLKELIKRANLIYENIKNNQNKEDEKIRLEKINKQLIEEKRRQHVLETLKL